MRPARHLRIFWYYLLQNAKVRMEYRLNFLFAMAGIVAYSTVNILVLWMLFYRVPDLQGWSFEQILMTYGMAEIAFGFCAIFFFQALFSLPEHYIVEGNLDRLLVRPLPVFWQLLLEQFYFHDILIVLKGFAIVAYAQWKLRLGWGIGDWAAVCLFGVSGAAIYGGLMMALASLSFWLNGRGGFYSNLFSLMEYSRYPATIFPGPIRFFFSWIMPFAFVAFYPVTHFFPKAGFEHLAWLSPAIAAAIGALAVSVFHAGVRRYESTGT